MKEYFMYSQFDSEDEFNDFLDILNNLNMQHNEQVVRNPFPFVRVPRMPHKPLENPIIDQEIAELARYVDMSLRDFQDVMREDLKGRG